MRTTLTSQGEPADGANVSRAMADVDSAAPVRPDVRVSNHRLIHLALILIRAGPALILAVLIAVMSLLSPVFLTHQQPRQRAGADARSIAILAIGQLLVILTRGIDLSVGSTLALCRRSSAPSSSRPRSAALADHRSPCWSPASLVGAVNGLVYVYGRLPHPFIVTLATLSIARGLALGLSGGQPIAGMPADRARPSAAASDRAGCRTRRSSSPASRSSSRSC